MKYYWKQYRWQFIQKGKVLCGNLLQDMWTAALKARKGGTSLPSPVLNVGVATTIIITIIWGTVWNLGQKTRYFDRIWGIHLGRIVTLSFYSALKINLLGQYESSRGKPGPVPQWIDLVKKLQRSHSSILAKVSQLKSEPQRRGPFDQFEVRPAPAEGTGGGTAIWW